MEAKEMAAGMGDAMPAKRPVPPQFLKGRK
jgi:hypothetical protein